MITRIVKLEFQEDRVQDFLDFFDTIKHVVNEFPGCEGMKLYVGVDKPSTIMTYSFWQSQSDLNNYRDSSQFGEIWPTIKPWFAEKPDAWTLDTYFDGIRNKSHLK